MPKAPETAVFRIRSGVLLDENHAVVIAGHRELEAENTANTFVFLWHRKGEWAGRRYAWNGGSVTAIGEPAETIVVGEDGQFALLSAGMESEGVVGERRILRSVQRVGDTAFAVGLRGACYFKRPGAPWTSHEPDLGREANLEAVAGASEQDIVAVGWTGQIWSIRPGGAAKYDAGTNVILTAICYGGDGYYYACGQRGMVVRGLESRWEVIRHGSTNEDLWHVHWFQGSLYVASTRFLYQLREDGLHRVRFGEARVLSCYHLTSFEDRLLWSIGSEDVMEYDGQRWTRILGTDEPQAAT